MVSYRWNHEKNLKLKRERGVSFEQAVMHVERGDLLDVIRHPNTARFPHQKVLVIRMRDYVYAVPFVEEGDERFLKTIIPSRKLTRQYSRIGDEESEA
jgi:uncharacterized DUF497 family protein